MVLFEMLTGQRLFTGETISDTLASVLKTDPNWRALPAAVPPRLHRLLRDQAIEAVRTFRPLSSIQVRGILQKTKQAAMTGHYELFKTSDMFDGTARNPDWMK